MQRTLSWLVALVLLAASLSPARAGLVFFKPTADAGEVKSGRPLSHRFGFYNSGTVPLEVVEIRPSCGCLRPKLEKRIYQPGEAGEIALEVHTLGEAEGPHRWTLQVAVVSGGVREETTATLTGNVTTEVTVRPASLVIIADSMVRHELILTDLRSQVLHVREVRGSSPDLKGSVVEEFLDNGGHGLRIALEVGANTPEGRHEETVSIFTNDLRYRELKVPVTVVKRPRQRLTSLPASVDLQVPAGQALQSRIVLLEDRQGEVVVIERVDSDDPAIGCQWARGPGNRATVRVTADRAKANGPRIETLIRVQVSSPEAGTLTVPVTCVLEGSGGP